MGKGIEHAEESQLAMIARAIGTIVGARHAERDPGALARVTFNGMTAKQLVADQRSRESQGSTT